MPALPSSVYLNGAATTAAATELTEVSQGETRYRPRSRDIVVIRSGEKRKEGEPEESEERKEEITVGKLFGLGTQCLPPWGTFSLVLLRALASTGQR